MPRAKTNGIEIEYDTFGDRSSPALILIMGLASQMIRWEKKFCQMLADKGLYVIRFDNRDIGLSSKIDEAGVPDVIGAFGKIAKGEKPGCPYTLDDMADDVVGLLDALNIEKAHICGASMGGMIAQTMAIRNPSRILSMISIMSTTGDPALPPSKPEAQAVLITPVPVEREKNIEYSVKMWRTIGSPGFPFDEEKVRAKCAESYDRSFHPSGVARQLMAIICHGNRKPDLTKVDVPTLVIHGSDDPLVPIEGGKDTADAIPGAKLEIIEGMGHDMPPQIWARLVDLISEHIKNTG